MVFHLMSLPPPILVGALAGQCPMRSDVCVLAPGWQAWRTTYDDHLTLHRFVKSLETLCIAIIIMHVPCFTEEVSIFSQEWI